LSRIVIEHRQFDNAGGQFEIGVADLRLDFLERGHHLVGVNHVWIEADQIRRIRGTNLRYPRNAALLKLLADRHPLEEGLKGHFLVDFGEDMLVRAKGITDSAHAYLRARSLL
jgi:hypothetical protein